MSSINEFDAIYSLLNLSNEIKNKKCKICQEIISSSRAYNTCNICQESLITLNKKTLDYFSDKVDIKNYTCNICQESFKSRKKLYSHKYYRHITRKYCSICRVYMYMKKFEKHMREKHNIKSNLYSCDCCDETFETNKDLRNHFRNHAKKILECQSEDCDFKSRTLKEMKLHIDNEHENTIHYKVSCNHCFKIFKDRESLLQHLDKNLKV